MACLFIDGFDAYSVDADINRKWSSSYNLSTDWDLVAGRYGGSAIQLDNATAWMQRDVANAVTLIIGFDYQPSSILGDSILEISDASTIQLSLYQEADGTLSVKRGTTTILGTSSLALVDATYYHIELKVTIDNTTGAFELRVDGGSETSGTSQDTQESANAYANEIRVTGPATGSAFDIDNFYLLDDTGAECNDFLGVVQVQTLYPDGDTADSGFAPKSGSGPNDYKQVDEASVDDDTSYIYSDVVGAKSLFDYTSLSPEVSSVHAAQMVGVLRRESTEATPNVALIMKSGATEGASADIVTTDTYDYSRHILHLNPDTAAAFTPAEVNAMTAGIEVKS